MMRFTVRSKYATKNLVVNYSTCGVQLYLIALTVNLFLFFVSSYRAAADEVCHVPVSTRRVTAQ